MRGDGVVTMNSGHASLREALAAGALARCARRRRRQARPQAFRHQFLPVIPNPDKILCAGINYHSHASETGRELPKQPSMFLRFTDTLVGHEGEMIRPTVSTNFDFEGELAIVIGKGGRHIPTSARSTMSPATPASSTAACATTRNSRSPRARTFPAPARSGPGW